MLRSPPVSNPAAAMASTVRRFGSQPEASHDHGFAIRSWNRPISTVAADMLEDHQPAAGCEHAADLAEGSGHVVDRAQHQPDVYRVETVVREWNRLADPIDDVDRNAATASQSRSHSAHRRLWLHGSDRGHRGRKEHQVGSRAETDHQQPAGRIAHRLSAIPAIEQPVEDRHAESIDVREQRITRGSSATQIQSERRIFVAHQRDVHGHPIAPPNDTQQKVEHALQGSSR